MCRQEIMRVVSRVGVLEGMYNGSALGFIRVVVLVCVRKGGMPVRLIAMGTMSTCVLASVSGVRLQGGVFFNDEVVGVFKVIIFPIFPLLSEFYG
jgi:hypothetical protein